MRNPYRVLALLVICSLAVWVLDRGRSAEKRSFNTAPESAPVEHPENMGPLAASDPSPAAPDPVDARRAVDDAPRPRRTAATFTEIGRVLDGAGQPLTSFFVEARPLHRRPEDYDDNYQQKKLIGRDGLFSLESLFSGEWVLVAVGPSEMRTAPAIWSVPSKDAPLTFVVAAPVQLNGVVTSDGDVPLARADVFLSYAGEELPTPGWRHKEFRASARTDTKGRFSIESVRPGKITLVATHQDYCNSDYLRLDILPKGVPEVRLQLRQGAHIVVSIDPSLGVLQKREVNLYSFNGLVGWRETTTDATGHFEFEHVIPPRYVIELKASDEPTFAPDGTIKERTPPPPGTPKDKGVRHRIEVRDGETVRVVLDDK